MTNPPYQWEESMWAELDAKPDLEQIMMCSVWITYVTQELLTKLANRRRIMIAEVLRQDGWDKTRLAETIGSRRTAINRLAEEGRALLRLQAQEHELAPPPSPSVD